MRPGQLRTALPRFAASILIVTAAAAALALPSARGIVASAAWNAGPHPVPSLEVALQSLPTSCGPAALATLSGWLGRPRAEGELLALAKLGPEGVTLSEFARLAHAVDLPGSWYRARPEHLAGLRAPFVAHLEVGSALGHLVVVAAVAYGYLLVGDPAEGAYVVSLESFARRFSGRVYLLGGAA